MARIIPDKNYRKRLEFLVLKCIIFAEMKREIVVNSPNGLTGYRRRWRTILNKKENDMRKVLFISLALMLAACGVVQPVQQELPTPIIATVLVTVIAPTEVDD